MSNIISFSIKKRNDCQHLKINIDDQLWQIECQDCGEILDPISYLIRIAQQEKFFQYKIDILEKREKELINRIKTKCEHCGKMTYIS